MNLNYFLNFFLASYFVISASHPLSDIHAICERYVQCRSISTLDERLCLGNSRSMPFWLPPRNKDDVNSVYCHEKLKPYYQELEKLETAASGQLLACLLEQTIPMNFEKRGICRRDLLKSPKFDYSGDKTKRIPTNCFQGIKNRIRRQCGILKDCCSSIDYCSHLEKNEISTKINELKIFIKDLGKKCQLGLETKNEFNFDEDPDSENSDSEDPDSENSDSENSDSENSDSEYRSAGNINITVRSEVPPQVAASPTVDPEGRILVRIIPAEEELEKLKIEGDVESLEKLQNDLKNNHNSTVSPLESSPESENAEALNIAKDPSRPKTDSGAAEEPGQDLIPLSSPNTGFPKTVRTSHPYEIPDQLRKYSQVKTLNKLVEQYQDEKTESVPKNQTELAQAFPTPLIRPERLHLFFNTWESKIRGKVVSSAQSTSDPEAAAEYDRLLKTLNNLRSAVYTNN